MKLRTDEVGGHTIRVYDEGGVPIGFGVRRGGTAPFFPHRSVYEWRSGKGSRVKLPGGLWVREGSEWIEFGRWHAERGGDAEKLLEKFRRRSRLVVDRKESGGMGSVKKAQTFRLSESATKALEVLAWEKRLTKTDVLEKLLVGELVVERGDRDTFVDVVTDDSVILEAWRREEMRPALERLWRAARR